MSFIYTRMNVIVRFCSFVYDMHIILWGLMDAPFNHVGIMLQGEILTDAV